MRWLGRIVPIEYLAGFVLLCVLGFGAPLMVFLISGGLKGFSFASPPEAMNEVLSIARLLLTCIAWSGALVFGAYRCCYFAPFTGRPYFVWLLGTPYDGRKALPAGPLVLTLQDAVLVLSLEIVTVLVGRIGAGAIATALLLGYLFFIAAFLLSAGNMFGSYVVLLGTFLAIRFFVTPLLSLTAAGVTAIVACLIVKRVLLSFPWGPYSATGGCEANSGPKAGNAAGSLEADRFWGSALRWEDELRERVVGWPMGLLAPRSREEGGRLGRAVAIGFLVAFAVYCVLTPILERTGAGPKGPAGTFYVMSWIGIGWCAVVRVTAYTSRYKSPISFFGRLSSGRLIIPSYDSVYMSPLVAIITGGYLLTGERLTSIPLNLLLPLSWGVVTVILLGGWPSMSMWCTRGQHRIALARKKRKEFVQL